ncbi:VOC family protein [Geodermatophilus obscurus]|uniref:Glyoxalase/bleomycin resistance protein/dioxygenase n=1 Tax=Geodermatophilus obscurus (strain ATCC 25078 / DSM 43160 / JCM 3152 / CCUG 61914 / KCC A-0152 / KCTC 9177 / NBRC 13315 / NRRL B-3577 / G-20) TaxID=526225 RepID=D2SDJ9_GEOOG|nr:VOC family protein [Geodermatophilus obscurus]ADB74452.1 Glyoxalase/bleomycin resistance protein/dioxygenase [Geodermatophilus obscurus DSM 43160]
MTETASRRPPMAGLHHFSPTVTDVEASAAWYERVLGLQRIPPPFPHYGNEETGYAVVLTDMAAGVTIGLHHNVANRGEPCDETRTGVDHVAIAVPARSDLDAWAAWLDHLGVKHAGVTDVTDPLKFSVLVFRDPDNIQLEMFYMDPQ